MSREMSYFASLTLRAMVLIDELINGVGTSVEKIKLLRKMVRNAQETE